LSWVGFAVVTSDGNEVSRLRAACRALIGWIPAIAYILLAAHQRLAFVTRWLSLWFDVLRVMSVGTSRRVIRRANHKYRNLYFQRLLVRPHRWL